MGANAKVSGRQTFWKKGQFGRGFTVVLQNDICEFESSLPVSSAELRYETRQARFAEVPGPPARLEVEPRDVALLRMSQRRTLLACAALRADHRERVRVPLVEPPKEYEREIPTFGSVVTPKLSGATLYRDHDGYVKAVEQATKELMKEGFLLQEDADRFMAAAQASSVLR